MPIRQTARKCVWQGRRVIHRLTCVLVKLADGLMIQQVLRAGTSAGSRAFLFAAQRTGEPSLIRNENRQKSATEWTVNGFAVVNSRGLSQTRSEAKDRRSSAQEKLTRLISLVDSLEITGKMTDLPYSHYFLRVLRFRFFKLDGSSRYNRKYAGGESIAVKMTLKLCNYYKIVHFTVYLRYDIKVIAIILWWSQTCVHVQHFLDRYAIISAVIRMSREYKNLVATFTTIFSPCK